MAQYGQAADSIGLDRLDAALRAQSAQGGIVCHNAKALLCVKSEVERRAWLQAFLDTDWPNPILLPISLYQAEVPLDQERVCDLELARMPQRRGPAEAASNNRMKYDL